MQPIEATTSIDISVLIVCYRSLDYIDQCLASIYTHVKQCRFEVLLIDCSSDGTVDFVRANYPQVRTVENQENLGFSKGNNRLAEDAKGQHLLLLNADAYLKDDAFSPLLTVVNDCNWLPLGAVGGRAVRPDGSRDPGSRQHCPTLFRLFLTAIGFAKSLNGALPEKATKPAQVESLTGAFMMVPADVWREFGGLDESFFAYCEEMDLCMRLRRRGFSVVMTPRAEVVHVGGGGTAMGERLIVKTKAKMHLLRKHTNRVSYSVGGALIWFHAFIRFLASRLPNRSVKSLAPYRVVCSNPSTWWNGFQNGK
jgi:N-acetylglucosaminyl-diphospho-decaprenol L-rhamnosyltransferase